LPDVPARGRRAADRLGQLPAGELCRSSPELRRGFCATCGASLCTIADDDPYVCVTLASLDDPAQIAPILHMWTSSQASWLEIDDDLPRHEGQA
jgi:hypothetical protein